MLDLPVRQSMLLHSYIAIFATSCLLSQPNFRTKKYKTHNFSAKTTIHIFLHVFLYIEDVNCCGDAPIASLAQLSSNVESQIEVKRETVVSWWNHNSSFLSGQARVILDSLDQFGTVGTYVLRAA